MRIFFAMRCTGIILLLNIMPLVCMQTGSNNIITLIPDSNGMNIKLNSQDPAANILTMTESEQLEESQRRLAESQKQLGGLHKQLGGLHKQYIGNSETFLSQNLQPMIDRIRPIYVKLSVSDLNDVTQKNQLCGELDVLLESYHNILSAENNVDKLIIDGGKKLSAIAYTLEVMQDFVIEKLENSIETLTLDSKGLILENQYLELGVRVAELKFKITAILATCMAGLLGYMLLKDFKIASLLQGMIIKALRR